MPTAKTGWYVVESHFDSGVTVHELNYWLKLNKDNTVWEKPDTNYNVELMLDLVGEKYAVKDILKIKLEADLIFLKQNKLLKILGMPIILLFKLIQSLIQKDNNGIYCSELLLKANSSIAEKIGKKPYESWPSDIQLYYLGD